MKDFIIPLLTERDIDCRVQSVSKSKTGKVGAILLLYKDARVDMKILDQVFGPYNWQRTHEVINGNLFCNIDLWDDDKKCWVRKQDVGVESNTEKEKGQASDSFKRTGFNIGIGRELYTAPLIYVELQDGEYYSEQNGNKTVYRCYASTRFKVQKIGYDDQRAINDLVIEDRNGNVRYAMRGTPAKKPVQKREAAAQTQGTAVLKCETCGNDITEAEYNYSKKVYGVPACRNCQKFMPKQ